MKRFLLAALALALMSPAHAQLPPDKAVSTLTVAPGLEVSLWASEPLFVNPTSMDIDHLGRVWVCEAVNYRDTLFGRPPRRPEGDRIVILEDSHGTGRADKATVFYQAKELRAPLGIAVAKDPVGPGYKVYVCQSPDILLFEDKDGDGKADGPPRKLLSGFRGVDHDHGVHGILIGPDNKLYFSVGDQGVNGLLDKQGKSWTTNHTDCQAGTIWRCNLDGKNLELIAHNFRNEYEPCVDSFGTVFVSDNDDDGNQQTRICYVMPGGNYGYWPRGPGQSHWHEEQPGVVPKILRTYFGSPTGMCVYEGTLLPERYRGQPLHTDAGPRQLRCYHLKPDGAGYAVEREDMLTSTDTWFRPSDVCVAPDGSVYIADWYDPGVGGHAMGDTQRGRIYRLAPRGNRPNVPAVNLETEDGVLAALASPALSVRYMAMAKLEKMPAVKQLVTLAGGATQTKNVWLRARALWQLSRLCAKSSLEPDAQSDKDPRFRILAYRTTKDFQGGNPTELWDPDGRNHGYPDPAKDPSPAVRREILLLLRDVDPAAAKPLILELAKRYDGKDRFYLEAIGIAVGHDASRRNVILADFDKHFPEWNEQVAGLVWELRPPGTMARLQARLFDAKVPVDQRVRILDVVAGSPDQEAGRALLRVLDSDAPAAVRERAAIQLRDSLSGKWRGLRESNDLSEGIGRLLGRSDTILSALDLIAAAERKEDIHRIQALALDTKQSPAVRRAAVRTLGHIPSIEAVTALDAVERCLDGGLSAAAVEALGDQVPVWGRWAGTDAALDRLKALVHTKQGSPDVRRAAAITLAGTHPGSIWLLDAHDRKELPEAVRPDVARVLRSSPFQDLRDRAQAAFPAPSRLDPKKLPPPSVLAGRRGDVARGRALIAASARSDLQCLKCHTIRGEGGNIGPNLSAIGKKASRENLFESILLPSKAIADQYVSWVVETNQGLALTGLLVEETPETLTLRDANGKDTKIAKRDIASRSKSPNSLMPADLVVAVTEDDLVDLVEYLLTLTEEEPKQVGTR
jgi:putative membrane-bound dehydrogenase-like protein